MNTEHRIYGSVELGRLLGLTARQIQHYDETRLVRATVASHRRQYHYLAALALGVTAVLRHKHLPLGAVRQILPKITKQWDRRSLPNYIVIAGKTPYFAQSPEACVAIACSTRFPVHIVDMQALQKRLAEEFRREVA